MRHERKFIIDDYNKAINLIKDNPMFFRETYKERRVNNIYFDTPNLSNYNQNIAGISKRIKVRIRWYGELNNIREPYLEIKVKENELGEKLRFKLKPFKLNKIELSYLPKEIKEIIKNYQPILINSYKRRYFESNNFRITLDRDLEFYNLRLNKIKSNNYILEIKYKPDHNPKSITNSFPYRLVAFSKYVKGVDILNGCS